MDEKYREREEDDRSREASNTRESDDRDDLARRRKLNDRPMLTKREQQERWPIG